MARIRTIKPQFFRHAGLFDAEKETGLPLRIAFAGLWTAADREGRFKWEPRELKLDCLPYDDVDFSRVLDALATRGWIVEYMVGGVKYGAIPTWSAHQVVNNREAASVLPEPNENNTVTREARVNDASPTPLVHALGERKGREGEGKGKEHTAAGPRVNEKFEEFKRAYPRRDGDNPWKPAEKRFNALVKTGIDADQIIAGARRATEDAHRRNIYGTKYVPQAIKWLNDQRFLDCAANSAPADDGFVEVLDQVQLEAWDAYGLQQRGKKYPRNSRGGWRFPSKWPPGYEANLLTDVERQVLDDRALQ